MGGGPQLAMRNPEFAQTAALFILMPVLMLAGRKLANACENLTVPAFCHRHGWVNSPCEQCAVWETTHYRADQERADRIEAAALRQYKGAESGK